MKVLYIHQYFKTPKEPGGTRSYWFSRVLISRGHKVVMITSTNKYHPNPGKEMVDGIEVIYVKNEYSNYFSSFQRIKSFLRFVFLSIKEAKKVKDVDLVFATSTPLTVGAIALWLKITKGWNYIFEVRDLWPEFPIQIGAIKNKVLIWILRRFEKHIYNKSLHVIALSPGMVEGILKTGVTPEKVSMIPNMSKPDIFYPRNPSSSIVEKMGINLKKFNIIHFGSMGVANGLDYIIDTAILAKEKQIDDLEFLFLGDGATLPKLQEKTIKYGLNNVKFLGNHGMDVVSEVVNCCDASIICFLDLPILQTNSPNKLFDTLSAGKPVIVNSAGWTKELVEKENCGFYVNPNNPQDFLDKLMAYKENKDLLLLWGKNARRLSETIYDKAILSRKFAELIEKYGKS